MKGKGNAFWRFPKRVRIMTRDLGISCTDLYLGLIELEYDLLSERSNNSEWFEASIDMILKRCSIKRTALLSSLKKLEESGIVEVKRNKTIREGREGGGFKTYPSSYRLVHICMNSGPFSESSNKRDNRKKRGKATHIESTPELDEWVKQAQGIFNEKCPSYGKFDFVTDDRYQKLGELNVFLEGDLVGFAKTCENLENSSYLMGKKQGSYGIGGIDWLLKLDNFKALMEGNFVDYNCRTKKSFLKYKF